MKTPIKIKKLELNRIIDIIYIEDIEVDANAILMVLDLVNYTLYNNSSITVHSVINNQSYIFSNKDNNITLSIIYNEQLSVVKEIDIPKFIEYFKQILN